MFKSHRKFIQEPTLHLLELTYVKNDVKTAPLSNILLETLSDVYRTFSYPILIFHFLQASLLLEPGLCSSTILTFKELQNL